MSLKQKIMNLAKPAALYTSIALLSVFYGVYAHRQQHLIAVILEDALKAELNLFMKPWYLLDTTAPQTITVRNASLMQAGLTKLAHFSGEKNLAVTVIKNDGTVVQQWPIDWFDIWPDASHLSYFMQPRSRPGTMVHGSEILDDGSLVFNFEFLGLVKMDACGKVLWKLPRQTHHSIHIDGDGNIWTGEIRLRKHDTLKQPFHTPYYLEPYILKISPDGQIIGEHSIFAILENSNMAGLLHLSSINNEDPVVRGNTLHLNDVEVYPSTLPAGFFQPGDVMISLRNVNSVLVIDPKTWTVKHSISNLFTRQHDPDFIDGNTITVYDNNNRFSDDDPRASSRIVAITVPDNHLKVLFAGNTQIPFFTKVLGKQQTLANGNLLLTEGRGGRAIEITPDGRLAWEFINLVSQGTAAAMQEAERLPETMDETFFAEKRRQCGK